jgi:LPPG:FO 2-phospho-L-lactate transferase
LREVSNNRGEHFLTAFEVKHLITVLAGGVGAAKLLVGMASIVDQKDLKVIVNTGDDIELHGLHVSPDVDIAVYSLAGIADEEKGWGIREDTFHCLDALEQFTGSEWFNLGDRDFATHIFRTNLLRQGFTLTEVTQKVCTALGVKANILPMTDAKFETRIATKNGTIHFEEYMVKHGAKDEVLGVEYAGAGEAKATANVLEAIENAQRIVICPSNPVVSIGTILAVKGIKEALKRAHAVTVGVSPIIAGLPVKGPADKLLRSLGHEVSAFGVAELYADFLDTFIIDVVDASEKARIERLGLKVEVTNTLMRNLNDKILLAKVVLGL